MLAKLGDVRTRPPPDFRTYLPLLVKKLFRLLCSENGVWSMVTNVDSGISIGLSHGSSSYQLYALRQSVSAFSSVKWG